MQKLFDFDVVIDSYEDGFRTRVLSSPAGQAQASFVLPFTEKDLEILILRVAGSIGRSRRQVRRIESPERRQLEDFGSQLFQALFSGPVGECLGRSRIAAESRDAGLRIRLRLPGALANIPWEYLHNAEYGFLGMSPETALVRYVDMPVPPRPFPVSPPLRILAMISAPSDVPGLETEQEWGKLRGSLGDLIDQGIVEVDRLEAGTLAALQRPLRLNRYHVLHFIGHGVYDEDAEDGALALEGPGGRHRLVTGRDLGVLLRGHRSLRLVVLNACEGARIARDDPFGGVAQALVRQGIPAVIAMQFEISDPAALVFSQSFYQAIADGLPVDMAMVEARIAMFANGNEVEWATPVLYLRSPDGRIFTRTRVGQSALKARQETDRKACEEAERQARQEADRKAREEADRKAREEADRKAREEAERQARQETARRRPTSVQAKSELKPPKAPAPKPPIDVPPERMRLRLVLRDLDNGGMTGQPVACIPPLGRQVKVDRPMVKDGDVVAKGQPLLVVRTAETGNERPTVLTSPWPSRIQFLVRAGEKLSADSHIAALDIDVAYALTKPGTTEYHVDLDGAITVLTIDESRGPRLRVRPSGLSSFPVELHRYITSHKGSRHGQVVGAGEISQVTPITLLHPLGAVHASMKLGSSRDSLMLGTDSLSFDTTGIVRGVKFFGSAHARFMQLLTDRNR